MKRIMIIVGVVGLAASIFFGTFGAGACGKVMAAPERLDTHIEDYKTHEAACRTEDEKQETEISQMRVDVGIVETKVGNIKETVDKMDGKLDELLRRPAP